MKQFFTLILISLSLMANAQHVDEWAKDTLEHNASVAKSSTNVELADIFSFNYFESLVSLVKAYQSSEAERKQDETPAVFNQTIEVNVYPNPVINEVNIDFSTAFIGEVALYSISGNLLIHQFVDGNQVQLDLSTYPKAIYLLRVIDENNEVQTFKLFKR